MTPGNMEQTMRASEGIQVFQELLQVSPLPFFQLFYKIHFQAYFLLGSSGIHMNQVTLEKNS